MQTTDWTDDLRAKVIKDYVAAKPTPENSTEIIKEIADATETTVNGVRAILHKAEVYVKVNPVKDAKEKKEGSTSTRVNKAEAAKALTTIIEANGLEVDADIISKMTGKATAYVTTLLEGITSTED